MYIPPSDLSYAGTLTSCGTMVETVSPTGLSPPSVLFGVAFMDGSKKELVEFEPYLISSGFAINARDWDEGMLREYQAMVVGNRRMAEESYSLACSQSNAMMAISGVVLAMTVPFLSNLSGFSCWIVIFASIREFTTINYVLTSLKKVDSSRSRGGSPHSRYVGSRNESGSIEKMESRSRNISILSSVPSNHQSPSS